ncbi:Crp/Fnr family transcriptional regulator [Ktedonosporobacter rubrisoli]|uniref:Crp/Fnr family transcriptional regulator n=1 Tax=Ktedonosporobacter rubrisoli TaxID=2509675 RepID=A0A4P6K5G3_KTERU|nr:Crp/Fnr family transcriptional regulator [Ktedonosporobacter rubrisoli]QBD83232.1 Crp/Fnr family transcriptional regulator [Ktedonosporobacter rubrisoli]
MPVDRAAIHQIALFTELGPEDLEQVASIALERRYARGDIIILEGDLEGALYYVHTGLVKVFKTSQDGKEQVLRLISPGHTFNDVPAFDGGPNPASAAAMEPSIVYMLKHLALKKLIMERPAVAGAVALTFANALRHMVALVEDLSFRHVTSRVAKILLDQEKSLQSKKFVHRLTQQEIAALAGTAREVVGRALKELEAAGAIEVSQGRIVVLNKERLLMLSH